MKTFFKVLDRVENGMVCASFMGMMFTVLAQVITRFILPEPLIFTEELARYFYIWLTFSGMSWLVKHHGNISLELVTERFNPKQTYFFNIITNIITFVVLVILLSWCPDFLVFQASNKSPAMHVNMAFVYGILPFAFVMTCIRLLQSTYEDIQGLKELNRKSKEAKA